MKTSRYLVLLGLGVFCFGGFLGAMKQEEGSAKETRAERFDRFEKEFDEAFQQLVDGVKKTWRITELEGLRGKFFKKYRAMVQDFSDLSSKRDEQWKNLKVKIRKDLKKSEEIYNENRNRISTKYQFDKAFKEFSERGPKTWRFIEFKVLRGKFLEAYQEIIKNFPTFYFKSEKQKEEFKSKIIKDFRVCEKIYSENLARIVNHVFLNIEDATRQYKQIKAEAEDLTVAVDFAKLNGEFNRLTRWRHKFFNDADELLSFEIKGMEKEERVRLNNLRKGAVEALNGAKDAVLERGRIEELERDLEWEPTSQEEDPF